MIMEKKTVYIPTKEIEGFTLLMTKEINDYLKEYCSISFNQNKTTTYIPSIITRTEKEDELKHFITHRLEETTGYFFTESELKQLLQDYTDKIVENVEMTGIAYGNDTSISDYEVDIESITFVLPDFLKEQGIK